jgi:AraC family transcriptional regulator
LRFVQAEKTQHFWDHRAVFARYDKRLDWRSSMSATTDIARFKSRDTKVAHCLFPAWDAGEYVSVSEPSSIAVSFTTQRRSTVLLESSRYAQRNIPAGSMGTAGAEPIAWVRVNEPSECLEVTASAAMRREIADEFGVLHRYRLEDLHGVQDPVVWIATMRLRKAVRQRAADDLEIETLVRQLYARVLVTQFGGRPRERGDGGLNKHRLRMVLDWIEAYLDSELSIRELAAVAALSPAHFMRSFKRSVGVSPYQFVRLRRLERARQQLARGANIVTAAQAAVFTSVSQFRSAYRDAFGHAAQHTPRRGGRTWIQPGTKQ